MSMYIRLYPIPSATLPEGILSLLSVLTVSNDSYFGQFLECCDWLREEEWAHQPPLVFNTFSKPELMLSLPEQREERLVPANPSEYFFLRAKEFRRITVTTDQNNGVLDWDQAIVSYLASLHENLLVMMRVS